MLQLTITDEHAAAAFVSQRTRAIIFELMKHDRSLSELRNTLGMSLSLLHYHVERLRLLGIVAVSATRPRSGRPIKIYRAVASEFRVPGSLARHSAGEGLKDELQQALQRAELRHPTDTDYFLDEQGAPRMRRSTSPHGRAYQRWWRLRLGPSAAAKLNREMSDLLAKYEVTEPKGGHPHICHFALVESR